MRERPRRRGSFIAPGLAATLGALAVAPAASPAASSVAPPSLAQFISAICSAAYRSALPREAPFLSENVGAMVKMMVGMEIKPTGNVDRDFVDMMVSHHQGAIDMAQAELRHGHNEQLRRIAQEIIVTQQQEIAATRLALGQPFYVPITSRSTFHDAREPPRGCDAGLCRGLVREERLHDAPYS